MTSVAFDNFRGSYHLIANYVRRHGEFVAPRGVPTLEVPNFGFKINHPYDVLIDRNGFSYAFAAAEAAGLVGGYSDPIHLEKVNPTMRQFFDVDNNGYIRQHGAYGPRIGGQVHHMIKRLREDPSTRQAVLSVYDSKKDYVPTPDVPCTLNLQFTIRRNRLNMHVIMRSNDVWWGTPYDVFQFTQLQLTVARVLNIEPGYYHHFTNSMHLYERDTDLVKQLRISEPYTDHPQGFGMLNDTWLEIRDRVQLLRGPEPPFASDSEEWYADRLAYISPRYESR